MRLRVFLDITTPMKTRHQFILFLFINLISIANTNILAEKPNRELLSSANSTMFSIGKAKLLDTYLSPMNYQGIHLGISHELIRYVNRGDNKWANQFMFNIEFASTNTVFGSGLVYEAMAGYTGTSYRIFPIVRNFQLGVGPSLGVDGGVIYNMGGGNNPASARVAIKAGVGAIATYKLDIRKYSLYLRYQATLPVISTFFSPAYGQSYYEIFSLGNRKGIVKFGSFHNRFDMDNLLTLDLPIGRNYFRIGYSCKMQMTNTNHIKTRVVSNAFLFGYAREFIPYKRRNNKTSKEIRNPIF